MGELIGMIIRKNGNITSFPLIAKGGPGSGRKPEGRSMKDVEASVSSHAAKDKALRDEMIANPKKADKEYGAGSSAKAKAKQAEIDSHAPTARPSDFRTELEQADDVVGGEQEGEDTLRLDLTGERSVWIRERKDGSVEIDGEQHKPTINYLKQQGFKINRPL